MAMARSCAAAVKASAGAPAPTTASDRVFDGESPVDVVIDAGGSMGLGRHSDQLMGITAYGDPNFDQPAAQQLARELGIKSIGVQAMVTSFGPPGMEVSELQTWFAPDNENGSSPALRYVNATFKGEIIPLIASLGIRASGAEPWIYLKTGDVSNFRPHPLHNCHTVPPPCLTATQCARTSIPLLYPHVSVALLTLHRIFHRGNNAMAQ